MMGMLLFIPQGIDQSPYSYMFEENIWDEIIEMFTRDACVLYGLSYDSLLNVRYYIIYYNNYIINYFLFSLSLFFFLPT